jgi:hypothetical protein
MGLMCTDVGNPGGVSKDSDASKDLQDARERDICHDDDPHHEFHALLLLL